MPRSSRHKSHKQHKHSSKEAKEYSDSEEVKKDRDSEVVVRVSGSSEKRKLAVDGHSEEYTASKRRKERSDGSGVDRWSGDKDREKDSKDNRDRDRDRERDREGKGEGGASEKGLKSKVSIDSKSSKSSRRHESSSEKKEVVNESEAVKRNSTSGGKSESKSKSDKDNKDRDSSRKDVHQYKDSKDKESKDKERGAERSTKTQDGRGERSVDKGSGKGAVDSEGSRKQSAHFEERPAKAEVGNTEMQAQEDMRNPELDREHEKRMRKKRDGSDEKDKYSEDVRESNGRRSSTKDDRHKDEKYKDDRYKEKYREDLERDRVRDHRSRDDRARDDRPPKDHTGDRSDSRHSRDESKSAIEYRHKKSKTQNIDPDGNPHLLDDRTARYKDYRGKKRSSDDEDRSDLKPRSSKEHRYEVEKKVSSGKVESITDRGRSQSRLADGDSTASGGRRKGSPSSGTHFPNDSFRHSSKQAEMKYKDSMSEDRARPKVTSSREPSSGSGPPERAYEPESTDKLKPVGKPSPRDNNNLSELGIERSPKPVQLKEKSQSSTSIDRRPLNRTPVRRSLDESGRRSIGSQDGRDYIANDDRISQNWPPEKSAVDEFPHADGDTVSISSSINRNTHLPPSSPSVLPPPPPLRTGVDSPVFSSFEEDNRGKSNNRFKRSGDHNVGRGQGNVWKWPSPVSNGYIPYQQGPPPVGFHPMMQQFHGPPFFGVRPGMDLNPAGVPYHIPDADRYPNHGRSFGWRRDETGPHLHGWDGSNGAFGDDVHMHGKPEWDQNRHMMKDRSLDASSEWKGQHNGPMNFPPASWKEDNHLRAPKDEISIGKPGQGSRSDRSRSVSRAESIEIKTSEDIPMEQVIVEAPKPVILEKTPEPSKSLNNRGFCNYYLSKLDISVDLTHPELYKQCVELLDTEENSSADGIRDLSVEESENAGLKISNTFLNAPVFPKIKDSVFERAMALYKKQGEEMRAKFPISSVHGKEPKIVPTTGLVEVLPDQAIMRQNQGPVASIEGGKELIQSAMVEVEDPAGDTDKGDESITASNHAIVEDSLLTSGQEISEELFPFPPQVKQEEADPSTCEVVAEPVPKFGSEEPEEHVGHVGGVDEDSSTIFDVEKMEAEATPNVEYLVANAGADLITTSSLENLELAMDQTMGAAWQSTVSKVVDEALSSDGKGNISITSPEGQRDFCDDTVCGLVGVTDGSEALAPMSIECKSVNLSRIHSPESTH